MTLRRKVIPITPPAPNSVFDGVLKPGSPAFKLPAICIIVFSVISQAESISHFLVFLGGCSLLRVGSINSSTAAVYKTSDGLALEGYDAVAYFKENLPREGKAEFTTDYNGAKWQFESAENRDAFIKEPSKYAPQYGGYCAWAVGHNYTAKGDPNAWKIVDNKLYLNYNKDVQTKWQQEIPKYVADGDKNWQVLSSKAEDARKDK